MGGESWTILNDSFVLGYLTYVCFYPLSLSPLFFNLFNSASHWYWGIMKIYVGSNGAAQEKGNTTVVEFIYLFWFVKFLFVLSKLQVVNKPMSGWERERAKLNSSRTYYERTRRKNKIEKKNIKFWCLGYALSASFYFSTTSTSFKTPTKPFCKICFISFN